MVITDAPHEQSDACEFLARARAGDAQAFCRLIEPLQLRLFRQAVALSGDLSAAEDLICFRTRQYSETATDTTSTRLTARIRNHQSIRTTP